MFEVSLLGFLQLEKLAQILVVEEIAMLEAGHSVNERATDGATALHHAVYSCHSLKITTLLLQRGADPNVQRTTDRYTPLHILVSTSGPEAQSLDFMNKFIAYKADINARTFNNGSVLGMAARENLVTLVQRLLDSKVDPNSPFERQIGQGDRSALGGAAWNGHVESMKALINAGADVDHNDFGQTPLVEIVCCRGTSSDRNRYVEGARLLLDNGANKDQIVRGSTYNIMGRAAYNGNLGIVNFCVLEELISPIGSKVSHMHGLRERKGITILHITSKALEFCIIKKGETKGPCWILLAVVERCNQNLQIGCWIGFMPFPLLDEGMLGLDRLHMTPDFPIWVPLHRCIISFP
jgi:hypothetical protein